MDCSVSRSEIEVETRVWHAEELAGTEQRLAEGKEEVQEWEAAKKKLRSQFE
ncbi:MAG: acyl-protein synthetase [Verrucomicrobiota bacterium]|jgi:hypothetical protein